MPVAVPRTPFVETTTPPVELRTPQARCLAPLMPEYEGQPMFDWPIVTRPALSVAAGYTAISGSITRALNGIRPGNRTSGAPHPGLLALGMIEEVVLDIEGVAETNYRATAAGVAAYRAYIARMGALPKQRDKNACTNDKYKKNSKNI